ncbi:MAG: hypothetical protein MUD14_16265 [Hydrococcus sp. Prado102]|jgi:hypothetical protein|nr:hypothetical protein [Hydrococcus sp. Prado102]
MKKTRFLLAAIGYAGALCAIALALNACSTSTSETNPPQAEPNISEPSIPKVQAPEPLPLVVEPQFNNSMSSQPRVELKTQIGEDLGTQVKSSKSSAPESQNFENPLAPQPSTPEAQNFENPIIPKTQTPFPQNNPLSNQTPDLGTRSLQTPSQNPLPSTNNFQSPILTQPQAPIGQP